MADLGSFAASLAIPEALRPWAQSGLAALFVPGGSTEHVNASCVAPASQPTAQAAGPACDAQRPRWPEPWKALAERVRTAPKVIITYHELAIDLSGTPHPGRRKLFRDMLAYLAWPQGTSLFWPLSCLKDGKACVSAEFFASGVRHFGVRHVACFGAETAHLAREILQDSEDASVLELPAPLDLVDLLPHELHLAALPLKALVLK